MADETPHISDKRQLIFCIGWVDENLTPHEEFIGMYPLENTSAVLYCWYHIALHRIVLVIKDMLMRMKLIIGNSRQQCFDGAFAKTGSKSEVAIQLKLWNRKCLFTPCYGHALNLATIYWIRNAIRNFSNLKEIFAKEREICKVVKKLFETRH